MILIGYMYDSENGAIQAREQCASYYGLPTENGTTLYWVDYNFADLNTPQFWYINYIDSIYPILGEPIEFDVIFPTPI